MHDSGRPQAIACEGLGAANFSAIVGDGGRCSTCAAAFERRNRGTAARSRRGHSPAPALDYPTFDPGPGSLMPRCGHGGTRVFLAALGDSLRLIRQASRQRAGTGGRSR